jgi:hypothetical protein
MGGGGSKDDTVGGILPSRHVSSANASMSIRDVCVSVSSGDLVLISDDSFNADFITTICASRYSHVGIIYRCGDRPLLLEAVKELGNDIDVSLNARKSGVRLIDFENHLRHFDGKSIAIRSLLTKKDLGAASILREHMTSVIATIYNHVRDKPYENSFIDFFIARFPCVEKKAETNDKFFCSKLVAWCYIYAGLLSTTSPPSSFIPDDFSVTGEMKLSYPPALPFPGLGASFSELIKFSDEKFINTKIL